MSLDHLLVRSVAEQVFQLPSGCLCCVRRADIVDSPQTLLRQRAEGTLPPFRRMVIETSGLADPAPILYALLVERRLAETVACIDGSALHSVDYSPWNGWQVAVWPSITILRGKVMVEDGQFNGALADGGFIPRRIPDEIRAGAAV